mgnify:CR=1 FL=1
MTQSLPLISVVIPVYNVEAYLAQCLESVAAQSYKVLEILCVIDGSTDASAEIASQFARREPRCRIIVQPNQGLSVARNTGVAAATGDWVFFLDSDDWLPDNALQVLIGATDAARPAVVSGAVMEYWEETGIQKSFKKTEKRTTGHLHLFQQDFFALETMAWNKLYPRDWVREYPFFPGLVHEDLDFYWRFFAAHPHVIAIPDTVIYYRRRPGTLSRQMTCDDGYQDHYIHIVDSAFAVAGVHPSLRYHARRQSLKYLKYLRDKQAPRDRYVDHILRRYQVRDTLAFRVSLKLKQLLKI